MDNIFIERLWRSLKYEEVYLKNYETVKDAKEGIRRYPRFYNRERLHQSLGYNPPEEIYSESGKDEIQHRNRKIQSPADP